MLSLSQFHTNIHIKIKNTKSNNPHEIKEVVCSLINNLFSSFFPSGHLFKQLFLNATKTFSVSITVFYSLSIYVEI